MSTRSHGILQALVAIAGALIVIATFAFSQGAAEWISFALLVGVTAAALASAASAPAQARRSQLALSLGAAVIGAWTILVTLGIFSGATQRWLTFAAGAAVAGLGVVGHAVYDALRERRTEQADVTVAPLAARQAA